jgi:branched-chain amino acid transport system permease protein
MHLSMAIVPMLAVAKLSMAEFLQLSVNGLINGTAYGLLGVAFGSILGVTGRFHFAFTVTYALSAYIAAQVGQSWGMPFWAALLLGAAAGAVLGMALEWVLYQRLARKAGVYALLIIFVASLGLSIMGVNLISLVWIKSASKQIQGFNIKAINVGSTTFTNLQLYRVLSAWLLILALGLILSRTGLGRMIRAVRVNPEMSLAVGVSPAAIYLVVFAVGSFLGGVGAVFDAAQTAATAGMGFNPLFYAFVVAFLAGTGSPPVVIGLVGLVIGVIESWSGLFLSSQWSSLVVFTILFIYVALRPVQLRQLTRRLSPARA